jgi:TRAP-type C4-dicarboxylate transport system permease large subunit
VGVCLFLACRIANSTLGAVVRAVMPFLLAEVGVVFLLILVPALSSGLPALFR